MHIYLYSFIHSLFNPNLEYLKNYIIINTIQSQSWINPFLWNPQIALQRNQTMKTENKILACTRIPSLERKFSRFSKNGPKRRFSSNTIFVSTKISSFERKSYHLSKNEPKSRSTFSLDSFERESYHLGEICRKANCISGFQPYFTTWKITNHPQRTYFPTKQHIYQISSIITSLYFSHYISTTLLAKVL